MRYILLALLGGSTAFSVEKNHVTDRNARALDMVAGGYDKYPRGNFETTNGTSPIAQTISVINAEAVVEVVIVLKTLEIAAVRILIVPLGTPVAVRLQVVVAMRTLAFVATLRPQAAVAFLIESVTTTTTLTSVIYYTSTALFTSVSANLGVTTKFVTSTVTRDNIDVATVTNYVTSTKVAKRFLPVNPKRTEHPVERRSRPTPPVPSPSPTMSRGLRAFRHGLENIGLLPKRDVTSYIYDFVFVWDTYSSSIIEKSTVVSELNSLSTEFSTIVSTLFKGAKSTTTVVSTVVVTSTQVASPTPESSIKDSLIEPGTTRTSNEIVVMTTFVAGVTNSGNNEASTATTIVDGGGASGLQVATGVPTTTSRSDGSFLGFNTAAPTSTSTKVSSSRKKGDLSTGAKAGIGAGAGAVGLALLGAMVFFVLGKRRRPTSTISGDNSQAPMAPSTVSNWTPPPPPLRYSHLDSREVSYTERAAALARSMENMGQPASIPNAPGYQQPRNFSPTIRGASPSTPSELMMGYESPRGGGQEMGGTTKNMGWYMGPDAVRHEVSDQQYHEMPSSPEPSHVQHPRQDHAW
ncbi:hypothetical protein E0Z10_g10017 [Xylaria hypoxylon]|uniref:Mid2 domain-containing protein n=1 Tax=Xylaria hypoxylon TaxID=37992 RepID=A0A4Z0Y4R2_9PEZI|nr:hypothetical protein E0Z10_g10017 [Xylaria hypoxylon]